MRELIVEISVNPIAEDDRMDENSFLWDSNGYTGNGFLDNVADYVCDSENPYQENVKWFLQHVGDGVKYDEKDNSITIVDKEKIFLANYEEFRKYSDNVSLETYMNGHWSIRVQNAVNDQFGMYIVQDFWMPYLDFFRECKNGQKYYLGGLIEYHA